MFNILIIKLDAAGDVLRTTCILEGLDKKYPGPKHITWITNKKNIPILTFCPKIDDIYESEYLYEVKKKKFDVAINFDEDLTACDILYNISAEKKFGFTNHMYRCEPVNELSKYAHKLSKDDALKFKKNKKTYQQIIFEMCGMEWSGEEYGFKFPGIRDGGYIALNTEVGHKWPTKRWTGWDELREKLKSNNLDYQDQRQYSTLEEYFDWIANSKMVITSDTFGMHLAVAMNKPSIVFFGPTSQVEIEPYGNMSKLYIPDLQCSPCYKKMCPYNLECMNGINVDAILLKVLENGQSSNNITSI